MSEETKQPAEETPEEPQEAPQEEAPPAEEKVPDEKAEKAARGKKKKEKTYTLTREQMEAAELAARQLESVKDQFVRLTAEYDNYRKRTLKEKMDLVQTGGRDVLLEMLPVRDDVQRAVDAMQKSDDLEALRAGVTLISQKFTEALRRKGVTEIEVLDKEFDADFSEAVARFAAGDEKKGKVIDVVQTGYMLGEKVLRFAKVVVGE